MDRMYTRTELMEHLKEIAQQKRITPMVPICAEAYEEIDILFNAVEDAIDTLEAMDLHIDNPLYARLRAVAERS